MRYEDEEEKIMLFKWIYKDHKKFIWVNKDMCLLTTLKSFFTSNPFGNATSVISMIETMFNNYERFSEGDATKRDAYIDTIIAILQSEKST